MPKEKRNKKQKQKKPKHQPLETQILESSENGLLKVPRKVAKNKHTELSEDADLPELSGKILSQVELQQKEIFAEDKEEEDTKRTELQDREDEEQENLLRKLKGKSLLKHESKDDDEDDDEEIVEEEMEEEGDDEDVPLSEEMEASLNMFAPQEGPVKKTLADMIMEKIKEKQAAQGKSRDEMLVTGIDPRVVAVYADVGRYLKTYSSGKLPKAFKLIPTVKNWEQILELTKPEQWSVQAVNAATRLFVSTLKQKQVKKFYEGVLLPRLREDISTHKRLNYHLYSAAKRTIFKPAAFFSGILFPFAEGGCTAREAVIMAGILNKCSIPVLHSAVCLLKLAKLRYSGPTTLFMKTLLNKKYALPYEVLDAMVAYFCKFSRDERKMPVVWHQNLLIFVQRYKYDLQPPQKQSLLELTKKQFHKEISNEVKRELKAQAPLNPLTGQPMGSRRNSVVMGGGGMDIDLPFPITSASSSSASSSSSSSVSASSKKAFPSRKKPYDRNKKNKKDANSAAAPENFFAFPSFTTEATPSTSKSSILSIEKNSKK